MILKQKLNPLGFLPTGQAFRTTEGVDVQALDSGALYVGWMAQNEYARYTVSVSEDGESKTPLILSLGGTYCSDQNPQFTRNPHAI